MPCSHMAAVHNVLADALSGDPFLLLTLRGRNRDQLLAQLRKSWGDTAPLMPVSALQNSTYQMGIGFLARSQSRRVP